MLCLYLQAPFGAFRTFAAGSFRPTAGFVTHSAAYGLLLNVAGVEMRDPSGGLPMTLVRSGLPKFRLAIGALSFPCAHSAYQQLHNYPVGKSGEENKARTFGSKYNIVPARRGFLSKIRACLCLDAEPQFESSVRDGLEGQSPRTYGLPFLGDSNFLLDKLELLGETPEAHWFVRTNAGLDVVEDRTVRLTLQVDRADMSRTRSALFAPVSQPTAQIPPEAWEEVGY